MSEPANTGKQSDSDFLKAAEHKQERGLIAEFIGFLGENKIWWLSPILVVLGLVGVLLALGGTGVLPFIYTLF